MSTRRLMTIAATATVFVTAGMAWATEFRSKQTGDWSAYTSWQRLKAGSWADLGPNDPVPTSGDIATVLSSHTITVNSAGVLITTMTVNSGGTVSIPTGDSLELRGTGPTANIAGTMTITSTGYFSTGSASSTNPVVTLTGTLNGTGTFKLESSSGAPVLKVQASVTVFSSGGDIKGVSNSPEIQIDATSAARTLTSGGVIHGVLTIKGLGSNAASFVNNSVVKADAAGALVIDSSSASPTLNSISDAASGAEWSVASNGSAVLTFNKGSTGLHGPIKALVSGGVLNFNDSVTISGNFVYDLGTINVAASKSFAFSSPATGSCTPHPTSPINGAASVSTCP